MNNRILMGIGFFLVTGALLVAGCGKISSGPLSPLINPAVAPFGAFDDGSLHGWAFDSSNPSNIESQFSQADLSITANPLFQGNGSLQIHVPSGGTTLILTSYSIGVTFAPIDLRDKTMSMWVYLKSGLVAAPNKVGAQLFLKDTSYYYANGSFVNLTQGQWAQVTYNVNAPSYQNNPPPNLASIYDVGLQLAGSGSSVFTSDGIVIADSFGY
ncbi:MAG TPA: hypothetical protein VMV05_09970 [bacterium]|nr:hypothetical protein [bacterium]